MLRDRLSRSAMLPSLLLVPVVLFFSIVTFARLPREPVMIAQWSAAASIMLGIAYLVLSRSPLKWFHLAPMAVVAFFFYDNLRRL